MPHHKPQPPHTHTHSHTHSPKRTHTPTDIHKHRLTPHINTTHTPTFTHPPHTYTQPPHTRTHAHLPVDAPLAGDECVDWLPVEVVHVVAVQVRVARQPLAVVRQNVHHGKLVVRVAATERRLLAIFPARSYLLWITLSFFWFLAFEEKGGNCCGVPPWWRLRDSPLSALSRKHPFRSAAHTAFAHSPDSTRQSPPRPCRSRTSPCQPKYTFLNTTASSRSSLNRHPQDWRPMWGFFKQNPRSKENRRSPGGATSVALTHGGGHR